MPGAIRKEKAGFLTAKYAKYAKAFCRSSFAWFVWFAVYLIRFCVLVLAA
jgi:hypothetical protein